MHVTMLVMSKGGRAAGLTGATTCKAPKSHAACKERALDGSNDDCAGAVFADAMLAGHDRQHFSPLVLAEADGAFLMRMLCWSVC